MKKAIVFLALAVMAAVIPATGIAASEQVNDLRSRYQAAFNAGDAAAVADLYAEDAVLLPAGADQIEGRQNIEQFWQAGIQAGRSDLQIEPMETRAIGTAMYDAGTYSMMAAGPNSETATVSGDYLVLLEQDEAGNWAITRHIWNEDAPHAQN